MTQKSLWTYRFNIDDNILFLKDINQTNYSSLFEQPYLAFWKQMHEKYGVKLQFNIHGKTDNFSIMDMTDRYKEEWIKNSDWIRLAFHQMEAPFTSFSYAHSTEEKIKNDYLQITSQIERFAGKEPLTPYIVIHHAVGDKKACMALKECGVKGLGGGTWIYEDGSFQHSYYLTEEQIKNLAKKGIIKDEETGLYFFSFDISVHRKSSTISNIITKVKSVLDNPVHWPHIEVTFEEWAFNMFCKGYITDAMERVDKLLHFLKTRNIRSVFLEEICD